MFSSVIEYHVLKDIYMQISLCDHMVIMIIIKQLTGFALCTAASRNREYKSLWNCGTFSHTVTQSIHRQMKAFNHERQAQRSSQTEARHKTTSSIWYLYILIPTAEEKPFIKQVCAYVYVGMGYTVYVL